MRLSHLLAHVRLSAVDPMRDPRVAARAVSSPGQAADHAF